MGGLVEVTVQREPSVDGCTFGRLTIDGSEFTCDTLEDVVRAGPKVYGETAIPAGRYVVRITPSAHFGRLMPELLGVPGFQGVRIHQGNGSIDTAGCLLVGFGRIPAGITRSREAFAPLMARLAAAQAAGDRIWITLLNAPSRPSTPLNT